MASFSATCCVVTVPKMRPSSPTLTPTSSTVLSSCSLSRSAFFTLLGALANLLPLLIRVRPHGPPRGELRPAPRNEIVASVAGLDRYDLSLGTKGGYIPEKDDLHARPRSYRTESATYGRSARCRALLMARDSIRCFLADVFRNPARQHLALFVDIAAQAFRVLVVDIARVPCHDSCLCSAHTSAGTADPLFLRSS